MTKKTASGAAAKKYDATNCPGATVFDVDGDVFLKCVKSIDVLAGEVELFYEPYRVHNPTYTIKFSRIESIVGDAETPMRFNCYARSGEKGQVAQASSGAGGQVAQASSGAGGQVAQEGKWRRAPPPVAKAATAAPKTAIPSPAAKGQCLHALVDRSKGAVSVMGHFLELIESGNRQVVSIRVSTSLGEPMSFGYDGPMASSEKVSIELELCK